MDKVLKIAAEKYLSAGLCVLPADRQTKSPRAGKWSVYKDRLPTEHEIDVWFRNNHDAICIVCGEVSGNLELLDFDNKGELFDAWVEKIPKELLNRLVIESTQSGGWHVMYRCEKPVCGNIKLAQKRIDLADHEIIEDGNRKSVMHNGKKYAVKVDSDGVIYFMITQIETRGEGGLFLCDPTEGYELVQSDFENLPVLSEQERIVLLNAAWELNTYVPDEVFTPSQNHTACTSIQPDGNRPGDEFNVRGDIGGLLHKHGWILVSCSGDNEYWRRPGKEGRSWSASYSVDKGVFYVFSSNAHPFEAGKGYSHFGVYALLEHEGDYTEAARELHKYGYGTPEQNSYDDVDLSGILNSKIELMTNEELAEEGVLDFDVGMEDDTQPELRRSIIHGLLREGETTNLIAAPKTGKSWLAIDLAMCVARGEKWMGKFDCHPSKVLLIDNELHFETLNWRLNVTRKARGYKKKELKGSFYKKVLRGELKDLHLLGHFFKKLRPGQFKMIILDAFYRFLPLGCDENDNASIAYLYNTLDVYAKYLGCCFVLIHHTTKGSQGAKAVTDVGAGAGSQSRACDTHAVLRPHKQDGAIVFDAAVRSNPPVKPMCLSWNFPIWKPEPGLDPEDVEGGKTEPKKLSNQHDHRKNRQLSLDTFVDIMIDDPKIMRSDVFDRAEQLGMSRRQVKKYIEKALSLNKIFRVQEASNKPLFYSKVEPEIED